MTVYDTCYKSIFVILSYKDYRKGERRFPYNHRKIFIHDQECKIRVLVDALKIIVVWFK